MGGVKSVEKKYLEEEYAAKKGKQKKGKQKFIFVGQGTLVTADESQCYSIVQYADIGRSLTQVRKIMEEAAVEAGDACVGFHINNEKKERYLEGALLFDSSRLPEKLEEWPMLIPSLKHARMVWKTDLEPGKGGLFDGEGDPSAVKASTACGKGWEGWRAYMKKVTIPLATPVEEEGKFADLFAHVGEGTLVTEKGNQCYSVVQYRKIGKNRQQVKNIIEEACIQAGMACVGYHINHLQAALLYDCSKFNEKQEFPPDMPKALRDVRAELTWHERNGEQFSGEGPPNTTCASKEQGMGWDTWQCYRKK